MSLAGIGYGESAVLEATSFRTTAELVDADAAAVLERCDDDSTIAVAIRLLFVGVPVSQRLAAVALGGDVLDALRACLVVERVGDDLMPRARLFPTHELLIASDLPYVSDSGIDHDYVMGVGTTSLRLATLTVRTPSRTTLDLGCGGGFQSLLAAAHSERVVGIDNIARPLRIARFNAVLNGIDNVAWAAGDFGAAAARGGFDLVVSNPPFVISPATRLRIRDSGLPLDDVCRLVVRQAASLLAPGGTAQILCNWAHIAGVQWDERIAGWVAGTSCDALVLRGDVKTPEAYAAAGVVPGETRDIVAERESWLRYYEAGRVEAIGSGLVTLRRREGESAWFRVIDAPARISTGAGGQLDRMMRVIGALDEASDDAVMAMRFGVAPEVALLQRARYSPDGWVPHETRLESEGGLAFSGRIEPGTAEILAMCDGVRSLSEAIRAVADGSSVPADDVAVAALPGIRVLAEHGFLMLDALT